jgi:hypothetical protein
MRTELRATADTSALAPVFDALHGELTLLSRNPLRQSRVQVGRSVAEALCNGDSAAYRDQASNKDGSLRRRPLRTARRARPQRGHPPPERARLVRLPRPARRYP